jgi:aspartate racemase
MKTIGVLGGLGPQATMDFERRIHEASQRLIPAKGNGGYPPMIVYYCRFPPVLVDENLQLIMPVQVNPALLEAAKELGSMVDFLVITANGPHVFQQKIEAAADCRVLSMIGVALAKLQQSGWQKVGLLALGEPRIYMQALDQMGIEYAILGKEQRKSLDEAIMRVMEGKDGKEERQLAEGAIRQLKDQGAEGTILGCTEIPLLLTNDLDKQTLINPVELLAEATVQYALD